MPTAQWTTAQDVDAFLDARGSGVIYKHSTACSVSDIVEDRAWRPFVEAHPEIPTFRVLVIEHRPVSNRIAERLGITHESPQALVVREGRAVWNASHFRITADGLAQAWSAA